MPKEWKGSFIIPIHKEKDNIQHCGTCRGIKLMSQTMKLWERIVESNIEAEAWEKSISDLCPEGVGYNGCDFRTKAIAVETSGKKKRHPFCRLLMIGYQDKNFGDA